MVKGRPLLRWAGFLLVCVATSFFCIEAQGEKAPVQAPVKPAVQAPESGRPDLIKIDTLAAFGKLELPPVTFFHDKHTDVLLKEKKTCETCHFVEDGKLSLSLQAQEGDEAGGDQGDLSCEPASAVTWNGPRQARRAARRTVYAAPATTPSRRSPRPDWTSGWTRSCTSGTRTPSRSPRPRRTRTTAAVATTSYDKQTKKIFYAKGKEGTCRDCHLDKPKQDVKSLEQAAHLQCVACHLDLANKGVKDAGPYICAGCHGAEGQALVAKKNQEVVAKLPNKEVPRLKRGQPDAALLTHDPKIEDNRPGKPRLMNPVAFDHKAHEKYNDNCRSCHHATMDSCEKCHTLSGSPEGKNVTYEQAMHSQKSQLSCTGCHTAKQAAPNCAGCHNHISKTRRPDDATCQQCHLPLHRDQPEERRDAG